MNGIIGISLFLLPILVIVDLVVRSPEYRLRRA